MQHTNEYHAAPLEDNLFEWHFTIRGPPDSDFYPGVYHGKILLPVDYPFKPPNIMLLTPNGRFEIGKKICLSISAHHPEHWQPAWGIRLILEALISFFPTEANGALGSLDWTPKERKQLALESHGYVCPQCGKISELVEEYMCDILEEEDDKQHENPLLEQLQFGSRKSSSASEEDAIIEKNKKEDKDNEDDDEGNTDTEKGDIEEEDLISSSRKKKKNVTGSTNNQKTNNTNINSLSSSVASLPMKDDERYDSTTAASLSHATKNNVKDDIHTLQQEITGFPPSQGQEISISSPRNGADTTMRNTSNTMIGNTTTSSTTTTTNRQVGDNINIENNTEKKMEQEKDDEDDSFLIYLAAALLVTIIALIAKKMLK